MVAVFHFRRPSAGTQQLSYGENLEVICVIVILSGESKSLSVDSPKRAICVVPDIHYYCTHPSPGNANEPLGARRLLLWRAADKKWARDFRVCSSHLITNYRDRRHPIHPIQHTAAVSQFYCGRDDEYLFGNCRVDCRPDKTQRAKRSSIGSAWQSRTSRQLLLRSAARPNGLGRPTTETSAFEWTLARYPNKWHAHNNNTFSYSVGLSLDNNVLCCRIFVFEHGFDLCLVVGPTVVALNVCQHCGASPRRVHRSWSVIHRRSRTRPTHRQAHASDVKILAKKS